MRLLRTRRSSGSPRTVKHPRHLSKREWAPRPRDETATLARRDDRPKGDATCATLSNEREYRLFLFRREQRFAVVGQREPEWNASGPLASSLLRSKCRFGPAGDDEPLVGREEIDDSS